MATSSNGGSTRHSACAPHIEAKVRSIPALRRLRKGDVTLVISGHLVSLGPHSSEIVFLDGGNCSFPPFCAKPLIPKFILRPSPGCCNQRQKSKVFLLLFLQKKKSLVLF